VGAKVVCSAQKPEASQLSTAAAAAALAVVVGFGQVEAAKADISGLTPCSESKGYAKRLKNELKGLNKRLKGYEADSAPALALKATIDRTEKRFANYAKAGLLCGADGLPHLISDPGLALRYGHAGETFIPTIGFLYVAGWIGYVGRNYLNIAREAKKPTEKEIIIDVPLAIKLAFQGAGWPVRVVSELRSGSLTEADENITVSPR
jgi:photosystem I subunit 3